MKSPGLMQKNIMANYVGVMVLVAAPLIALPFYLNILGPKLFGLISFVTTIQALLSLMDSGISQVAVRELSIRTVGSDDEKLSAAKLLFGFERVYWAFSILAGVITLFLAGVISENWLNLASDDFTLGQQAVMGAAILFLVQFPGSLYRSFLVASEHQVILNGIMSSGLVIRHLGGVLLVAWFPSLTVYLLWIIFSAALETLVRARFSWHFSGAKRAALNWDAELIDPLLPDIIKLSGAVLLGSLASQMDKIILSKMGSIEQFGFYTIASTLSLGVVNLIYPLVQGYAPRIMQFRYEPAKLYQLSMNLFSKIMIIVTMGFILFIVAGERLLLFWLNDSNVSPLVYDVLSILLIGSAFNAIYHVGFYNWLSKSKTNRIYLVNVLSLCLSLVFIPVFINKYGMIGATFGFVSLNFIGLVLSFEWWRERYRV